MLITQSRVFCALPKPSQILNLVPNPIYTVPDPKGMFKLLNIIPTSPVLSTLERLETMTVANFYLVVSSRTCSSVITSIA